MKKETHSIKSLSDLKQVLTDFNTINISNKDLFYDKVMKAFAKRTADAKEGMPHTPLDIHYGLFGKEPSDLESFDRGCQMTLHHLTKIFSDVLLESLDTSLHAIDINREISTKGATVAIDTSNFTPPRS